MTISIEWLLGGLIGFFVLGNITGFLIGWLTALWMIYSQEPEDRK